MQIMGPTHSTIMVVNSMRLMINVTSELLLISMVMELEELFDNIDLLSISLP